MNENHHALKAFGFITFTYQSHDFAKLHDSEFAAECNWNSKVSQIRKNLGFLKSRKGSKFAYKMILCIIC